MSANKRMKRLTAFDAPPVLTTKRKRATVSYAEVEDDMSFTSDDEAATPKVETAPTDSDDDDDDDDDAFSSSRKNTKKAPPKKKIKKATKPKKPKEVKPFRFRDLPPELRDMIYEMVLVDPRGVYLAAKTRGLGKKSIRVRSLEYRASTRFRFNISLLTVNKQSKAEAMTHLYSHKFIFDNSVALLEFLAMIGHRNKLRLNAVKVAQWNDGRHSKQSSNPSGLMMLAGADNLKSLKFSGSLYGIGLKEKAKKIVRDGIHFFRAYGVAKGRKDAAVEILKVSWENVDGYGRVDEEERRRRIEQFRQHLRDFANTL